MADKMWGPFRNVTNPAAQGCTWDGWTHYDRINTPVISGPKVLKLMARIEALENTVKALVERMEADGREPAPIRQDRPRDHAG